MDKENKKPLEGRHSFIGKGSFLACRPNSSKQKIESLPTEKLNQIDSMINFEVPSCIHDQSEISLLNVFDDFCMQNSINLDESNFF